jgi:hypothetical protein
MSIPHIVIGLGLLLVFCLFLKPDKIDQLDPKDRPGTDDPKS